jgi:hypothetical protein
MEVFPTPCSACLQGRFIHETSSVKLSAFHCVGTCCISVKTLEELAAMNLVSAKDSAVRSTASPATPAPWKAIGRGQAVVEAQPLATGLHISPFSQAVDSYHCPYCSVHCNSQKQWDEHCASDKHTFNLNSDREHQWNYRQPPWGINGAAYEMCKL